MSTQFHQLLYCSLVILIVSPARADLIRLKQGGEIRGKIVTHDSETGTYVSVRTISGAMVTVHRNDVEFQARRPLNYEIYEFRSRLSENSIEAHWELADWCQRNNLQRQREIHLHAILKIDPEHKIAHQALGHIERDGEWTTLEEHMLKQGYVKYQGRYITPEEQQLLEHTREQRDIQKQWFEKSRLWSKWLTGRLEKQRKLALENFGEIKDPLAIPGLQRYLGEQPERKLRLLYLQILEQMDQPAAASAIVKVAVLDGDRGVRQTAISSLNDAYRLQAISELVTYLDNDKNVVIRRAASAIKDVGGRHAIPYLIDALVTQHVYRVKVPNPVVGVSIGANGNITTDGRTPFPPNIEAALRTGIMSPEDIHYPQNRQTFRWQTVNVSQENPEVLDALRSLTEMDFGYDERTWNLWWLSQNS